MRRSRFIAAVSAALLLGACASGPTIRYFPPQASLQQLQRQADGHWRAQVRLQNFSTGAMQFRDIALKVRIQDGEWTPLDSADTVQVGANSAEILEVPVAFSAAAGRELGERLQKSQSVRYTLAGSLRSLDPNRSYPLDYQGRLNPAPGLEGVYR